MSPITWDPDTIGSDPDVTIERDGHTVRQVLHLVEPFEDSTISSPLDLALRYLHTLASLFGIDPASLPGSAQPPTTRPAPGVRIDPAPILIPIRGGESTAVIFRQVQRVNLDVNSPTPGDAQVWGAGIRIMIARSPLRVTSAYSTLRPDLPHTVVARGTTPFPATREAAAARLGIYAATIEGLFVYELPAPVEQGRPPQFAPAIVYRRLDNPQPGAEGPGRRLPYRIVHDGVNVIRTQVLASGATGLVFQVDPRSQSARPEPGPYRPGGELDTFRLSVLLLALAPPVPGLGQELSGGRVYVAQDNPLGLDPPRQPPGASFDFYSRFITNHFAAVSAYYHCDAAFRMVEALGFPLADYFAGNVAAGKFPIRVVHRAPIPPGPGVFDGRVVNAQVVPAEAVNAQGPPAPDNYVVEEMRFALGDVSDAIASPLGIAADARFVWHEFGHALLIAATGEPEFRFAHSAGDALAAIICDLDSNVAAGKTLGPWRGVTFPWVEALRRHDRAVEQGWGWQGTLYDRAAYPEMSDPAGYRAEQILSSALFRLYLALGGDAWLGDAPASSVRRAAAAYTVYLIVRAIHQLGPAATTPALDVGALVGALVDSDIATNPYLLPNSTLFPPFQAPRRRGGAVRKVVRWVFERQGLYAPPGVRPWNAPGHPEPVDVYIEDGRHGEYGYTEVWEAAPPHLRLAAIADPAAPDAPPRVLTPSYVFVRVQNRGTDPMPAAATVRVFATRLPTLSPPRWRLAPGLFNLWKELAPAAGAVTAAVVPPLPPGTFVDFGPFDWRPILPGSHHLLACVEAPGDACNALVPTYACAVGPTRLAHLVPFDNNIAYRRVVVQL